MIYYIVFGLLILCFLLTCYREKAPIDDHKKQKLKILVYCLLAFDFVIVLFC